MKKRILMVASNATAFNGFCSLLINIKRYIPEYQYEFTLVYQNCKTKDELLKKHAIDETENRIIDFEREFDSSYALGINKIRKYINIEKLSLAKFFYYRERLVQVAEAKHKFKVWLENNPQDIVLLYGDRMIGNEVISASVAKEQKIPSLIVFPSASLEGAISNRVKKQKCIGDIFPIFDNYVIRKNKKFAWKLKNKKIIFYDSVEALAGYKNGCISLNPWVNGGGDSQFIAVHDERQMKDLEIVLGNKVYSKAILVGGLEDRDLYFSYLNRETIKKELEYKYKIARKKIVIVGVPRFAGYDRYQYTFKEYYENIRKLLKCISSEKWNILLSIHPKCSKSDYSSLEKEYDCRIVNEPLKDYIGIADAYVYESMSSTGEWAKALGIGAYSIDSDISGRSYTEQDFLELRILLDEQIDKERNMLCHCKTFDMYDLIKMLLEHGKIGKDVFCK